MILNEGPDVDHNYYVDLSRGYGQIAYSDQLIADQDLTDRLAVRYKYRGEYKTDYIVNPRTSLSPYYTVPDRFVSQQMAVLFPENIRYIAALYELFWGETHSSLKNGNISPTTGDSGDTFYFSVDYVDRSGSTPSAAYVYIDGVQHPMGLVSGAAANGTYRYQNPTLSAGNHNYYFQFTNTSNETVRLPVTGTFSGPSVGSAPPAPDPDPKEPNNTYQTAYSLGTIFTEYYSNDVTITPGDVDYYKFTTVATGTVDHKIHVQLPLGTGSGSTDLDIALGKINNSGNFVPATGSWYNSASLTDTRNEIISLEGLPANTYYLIVFGASGYTLGESNPDFIGTESNSYKILITPPPYKVATPTITPNGATSSSPLKVTLSCSTPGATIRYTTNGSNPTASSILYPSSPITISSTSTIKARAFKSNYIDSNIATSASFTFVPELSVYSTSRNVGDEAASTTFAVENVGNATMDWTAEVVSGGDWLSISSGATGIDSGTITVDYSANTSYTERTGTIRVTATDAGAVGSPKDITITQSGYTKVAPPVISPNGGTFIAPVQVTLSCSLPGATIRYTTDRTPPTTSSTLYPDSPITISSSGTLRARSFKSGFTDSEETTAVFIIDPNAGPELSVSPAPLVLSGKGGTGAFTVENIGYTNMPWTAEVISGGSWLSISSGASGTDSGSIITVASENNSGSTRSGTIRVTASGAVGSPMDVIVHQPAMVTQGSIFPWGWDNYGQVSNVPAGNDFKAVGSGYYHSLALKSDGSLVSWGYDDYGAVSKTPAGNNFVAIAGGGFTNIALKSDGSLVSWGYDVNGAVSNTPTGNNFTAIAGGGYHSLALKSDGSLVSWGRNDFGQVGNTPAGNDFVAIAAGGFHSLALKNDGSIVSWGRDDLGQVSNTPSGNDFVAIVGGGGQYSLALKTDGSLVSWGSDDYGQVSNAPVDNEFTVIAGGGQHGLALKSDGSLVSWGRDDLSQITTTPAGNNIIAITSFGQHSLALASFTVVPDVSGLSQSDAESAIAAANLVVGTIFSEINLTVPAGNVISQGLTAGSTVATGLTMDMVVSLGSAPPAINIDTPLVDTTVGNSTTFFNFSGTASDSDGAVTKIEYRLRSGSWLTANGTTSWDFSAELVDGPNLVEVRAQDDYGEYSLISSRTINREYSDSDNDGVLDNLDAFPNDPAASVDTDGDGKPDDWNPGMQASDSTTGLILDDDDDNDGILDVDDAFPLDNTPILEGLSIPPTDEDNSGIKRQDAGDKFSNLINGNPKNDLVFVFEVVAKDTSGIPPTSIVLVFDGHSIDMDYVSGNMADGALYRLTLNLGPANFHNFSYEALDSVGNVVYRYPGAGDLPGPVVELLNGSNMLGLAKDLSGSPAGLVDLFGSSSIHGWVSNGPSTNVNNGYFEAYDNTFGPEPGKGYFVKRESNATLPDLSSYGDLSAPSITINLQPGWNLTSNPYGRYVNLSDIQVQQDTNPPVSWLDACTNKWLTNSIYYYTGSDWGSLYSFESAGGNPDAVLTPWLGYWIYVIMDDADYKLIIPNPNP